MGWDEGTPIAPRRLLDETGQGVPWSHLAVTDTGVYVNGTRVADADGRPTGSAELAAAARAALELIDRLSRYDAAGMPTYVEALSVKNALRAALPPAP